MAFLALQKAVLEPVAERAGKALLDKYMPVAVDLLDIYVESADLDFDPEKVVKDYLKEEDATLTEKQLQEITEEVFKRWDLRVCVRNRNAMSANSFKF